MLWEQLWWPEHYSPLTALTLPALTLLWLWLSCPVIWRDVPSYPRTWVQQGEEGLLQPRHWRVLQTRGGRQDQESDGRSFGQFYFSLFYFIRELFSVFFIGIFPANTPIGDTIQPGPRYKNPTLVKTKNNSWFPTQIRQKNSKYHLLQQTKNLSVI